MTSVSFIVTIATKINHALSRCLQNVTVQTPSTSDIRFPMTSFPDFSASTTLHTSHTAAEAVTSEVSDWTTVTQSSSTVGDLTASPTSKWSWSSTTAAVMDERDVTTSLSSLTSTDSSDDDVADLPASSTDVVDVAYQRLMNLGVIVAVYAVVLVIMMALACRRRRAGVDYRRAEDWTDLDVCSGGNDDDDDVDDSAAFQRYWNTRRDLAERQRLLDSLRVDNISSVAAGHLIDRLPEQAV